MFKQVWTSNLTKKSFHFIHFKSFRYERVDHEDKTYYEGFVKLCVVCLTGSIVVFDLRSSKLFHKDSSYGCVPSFV